LAPKKFYGIGPKALKNLLRQIYREVLNKTSDDLSIDKGALSGKLSQCFLLLFCRYGAHGQFLLTTLSIMTLSMKGLYVTLSMNDSSASQCFALC
jgi:hypothetical protein